MSDPIQKYTLANGETRYKFSVYLGVNPKTGKQARTNRQGFKTWREANIQLNRIKAKVADGSYFESKKKSNGRLTFEDVAEEWYKGYKHTVAPATALKCRQELDVRILPEIGGVLITKLSRNDIQKLANKWREFRKNGKWISTIKRICRFAIQKEYIQKNPVEFVDIPKPPPKKKTKEFYEKEELKKFLKALEQYDNLRATAFIRLMIFCGLRRGEVLALQRDDFDYINKTVSITKAVSRRTKENGKTELYIKETPKTDSSIRTLSVDEETLYYCSKLFQHNRTDLLFENRNGGIMTTSLIHKWIKQIAKMAGVPPVSSHKLRKTHASLLFEAGANMKEVQRRLGHADISVTMNIYTQVTETEKERFSDVFQAYINKET